MLHYLEFTFTRKCPLDKLYLVYFMVLRFVLLLPDLNFTIYSKTIYYYDLLYD